MISKVPRMLKSNYSEYDYIGSLNQICPFITQIINSSYDDAAAPSELKQALIWPILNKPGLDKEILKNCRPVSNCLFGKGVGTGCFHSPANTNNALVKEMFSNLLMSLTTAQRQFLLEYLMTCADLLTLQEQPY